MYSGNCIYITAPEVLKSRLCSKRASIPPLRALSKFSALSLQQRKQSSFNYSVLLELQVAIIVNKLLSHDTKKCGPEDKAGLGSREPACSTQAYPWPVV